MRQHFAFKCADDRCSATLDTAAGKTGLLIVSGGNEIRSGAHAGQAAMAAHFAEAGYPVFRYDRRGIGDSEGENIGFDGSQEDIAAAVAAFRNAAPDVIRIVAFGNCDAASALALFHHNLPIDRLLLANPWVIETGQPSGSGEEAPTPPSAAAIRARYWARIKNPRSLLDLFTGKINLRKLASGLAKASKKEAASGLAARLAEALASSDQPIGILLAKRDTTALAFAGAWRDSIFDKVRQRPTITLAEVDSASHSFADSTAKQWLIAQIENALKET